MSLSYPRNLFSLLEAPSREWRLFLCLIWACLGLTFQAHAHGDLHEQIESLTAQLKKTPKDADLYLRRGELHRLHQDWPKARRDYQRALKLAPDLDTIIFCQGRMEYEASRFRDAEKKLTEYLTKQPNHSEAHTVRAQTRAKLRKHAEAIADYSKAIELAAEPRPELYLERARLQSTVKDSISALNGLEDGLKRLGPIPALELEALAIETRTQQFEAALARIERLRAQSVRQETWLEKRGDILQAAGRSTEARAAYEAALQAIRELPERLQNLPATESLRKSIQGKLDQSPTNKKTDHRK